MNRLGLGSGNQRLIGLLFGWLCGVILFFHPLSVWAESPKPGSPAAERPWPLYVPHEAAISIPTADTDWTRNDLDAFVWEKLNQAGLTPSPPASRRALIRRLYFDLIGLPPSPEDVEKFLHDTAEDAYAALVDRLLDDPRHGERWARLWLDLARYADTAGYEGDPDLPHAWRYRDYVIDAFNQDKPYDLFIREQLAGDEFAEIMGAGDLPQTPAERVVALTFLRLAPFTEPRGDETRHELLSEMTSTVGSVFLGMTVGCAKCHDHKHDDIPTADFYRLKAFFATIQIPRPEPGDAYQIGGPLPAKFYREGEEGWAKLRADQLRESARTADAKLASLRDEVRRNLDLPTASGSGFAMQSITQDGNHYVYQQQAVHDGTWHWSLVNASGHQWSFVTDGVAASTANLSGDNRGHWFADLKDVTHLSMGQHTAGTGAPTGNAHRGTFAQLMIFDRPLDAEDQQHLADYLAAEYGNGESASEGGSRRPDQLRAQLRAWFHAGDLATTKPGQPINAWTDRVAGLELTSPSPATRPQRGELGPRSAPAIVFDDDFLIAKAQPLPFAHDQEGALVVVYSATHKSEGYGIEVGGGGEFVSTVIHPAAATGKDPVDALFARDDARLTKYQKRRYAHLRSRDRFVKQHLKRLQPVAMSLRHSYGPPYEPGVPTSFVMIRGEYDNLGEEVAPGFPSAITGSSEPADIRLDPFKRWPTRSRRMALANWIASPDNPLTARVMANRIWHWHFGQGLVRTPSDFGYLSGGPSHRVLLDWLAVQLVKHKWSMKSLHRLILNSATYRQSSQRAPATALTQDPDNRLLWRFPRRRLEAEAIRDAVLSVSGRLNPEQFGLPIFPPLPGDVADAVKYSESKWDTQHGEEGRKRSIYIYQQRTLTMPLMQSFDSLVCDESRPRRQHSTTPLQALAMINGDFVNEEAPHFAERVRAEAGDRPQAQLQRAFLLAVARPPSETERQHLLPLLNKDKGLLSVCRILLNTSEFLYID